MFVKILKLFFFPIFKKILRSLTNIQSLVPKVIDDTFGAATLKSNNKHLEGIWSTGTFVAWISAVFYISVFKQRRPAT